MENSPRCRSVSYSNVPATTMPTTPPVAAIAASTPPDTSKATGRPYTNTTNVVGTTAAPTKISAGTRCGLLVAISVWRSSSNRPKPTARTANQLQRGSAARVVIHRSS